MEKLTEERYRNMYIPLGGFLFIEKDMAPEKSGRIYAPNQYRDKSVKLGMTGRILKKSPIPPGEEKWHYDLWSLLKELGNVKNLHSSIYRRKTLNETSFIMTEDLIHHIYLTPV